MQRVGNVIRNKYYWFSIEKLLYLVIDNVGYHGTDECVDTYATMLINNLNIEIIH